MADTPPETPEPESTALALPDRHLIALSAGELQTAQAELTGWCTLKIKSLEQERDELQENLTSAEKHKWKVGGLRNAVKRAQQRISYYDRMRIALLAGYVIIPNFPIDVLAVRVSRAKPRHKVGTYRSSIDDVVAEQLPAGEGRYVDPIYFTEDISRLAPPDSKGEQKVIPRFKRDRFDEELELPLVGVKPQILTATALALQRKVFDQIGIVREGSGDPIVIGRILAPRSWYSRKQVSFFIAWWLSTTDL